MLKLKSKLIIAVMLVFGVTAFMNCEQDEKATIETNKTMKVSDFAKSGEIHNAFLTNVKNNFEAVKDVKGEKEKIDIINDFNKKFASSLDLSSNEKELIIQGLEEHKEFVVTDNLTAMSFGTNSLKSNDDENIFELIEKLKTSNQITDEAYSILNRLTIDLKSNYDQSLSDTQLKLNIQKLITEFDNFGYNSESGEGQMIASILAISVASIEWWEENPDAFGNNLKSTKALPLWAAADIIGGVAGGGLSAAIQYGVNGDINWEIVGYSALGGAVSGSTGIVGKAAKFLSSWF